MTSGSSDEPSHPIVGVVRAAVATLRHRLRGEPRLVLLCGSYAAGRASTVSDVDVVVVCDTPGVDRIRATVGSTTVDVFRESDDSIDRTLLTHRREHVVSMLASAVVIDGDDVLAARFSGAARDALSRPPKTHSAARRFSVSEKLRDAVKELQRPPERKSEVVLLTCFAIDALIEAIHLKHGLWTVKRRQLLSMLSTSAPEAASDLAAVTVASDLAVVVDTLAKYIDPDGGTRQKF